MKTVFRIEHPSDGLGVFHSGRGRILANHSHYYTIVVKHTSSEYPAPFEDKELMDQTTDWKPYKFAFNTLEHLDKAFSREDIVEMIEELGFKVYALEVTEYFQSKYQTIYKNPVGQIDISKRWTTLIQQP